MTIKARRGGWQADVAHGGRRYRRQFRDRFDAETWELEARAALMKGGLPALSTGGYPGGVMNLQELLASALQNVWGKKASAITNAYNGANVVAILGAKTPVKAIGQPEVVRLKAALTEKGMKDSTVNRHLSTLSVMMRHAEDLGLIEHRPRIKYERETEHRTRQLSFDEERRLFTAIRETSPRCADLCIFLVETGLRYGEAVKLTWDRIQGPEVIVKKTKGGKPRRVPLTRVALEILARQREVDSRGPWVGISHGQFTYHWQRALESLGWQEDAELVPHALRHTFASRLVAAGVDIVTVQSLLGHSSIKQTMRYAHMSPKQYEGARAALEAARTNLDSLG